MCLYLEYRYEQCVCGSSRASGQPSASVVPVLARPSVASIAVVVLTVMGLGRLVVELRDRGRVGRVGGEGMEEGGDKLVDRAREEMAG